MKTTKRLLALLLCAALLLGLAACGTDPAPTDPPVTEAPGLEVYEEALKALEGIQDVKLNITVGKTTTVAGQEFIEESNQTLIYAGLGTDAVKIRRTDSVNFDGFNTIEYEEVYADGTLYVAVDDSNSSEKQYFSGDATAEGYLPVILLDASRYGSVTQEHHGTASTMIHFADPTAPEDWVLPEGAEMVDASGAALISEEGKLQRFNYAITYTYGPAEITLDVESYVVQESNPVEVPANAADYTSVASIEAIRLSDTDDTSDLTEEELALYNEYNDAMLLDRNADMVTVATEYLESGDVVFYAVGLAHLLTGNGLVDALRDAGYTVELVPYA